MRQLHRAKVIFIAITGSTDHVPTPIPGDCLWLIKRDQRGENNIQSTELPTPDLPPKRGSLNTKLIDADGV